MGYVAQGSLAGTISSTQVGDSTADGRTLLTSNLANQRSTLGVSRYVRAPSNVPDITLFSEGDRCYVESSGILYTLLETSPSVLQWIEV